MKFKIAFNPKLEILDEFNANENEIKNEPMFFSSSLDFAYNNGGEITKNFIDSLPDSFKYGIFDSRVHMLMPGWYPCIPGWHHDDIPRGKNGQPNYANPEYYSEHIMGLVNGGICPTKFITNPIELTIPSKNEIIYRELHKEIELMDKNLLQIISAPDKQLIYFDCNTFHCGTKCIKSGWRWFARATINTNRKITNEIRSQVQVYLENPFDGW